MRGCCLFRRRTADCRAQQQSRHPVRRGTGAAAGGPTAFPAKHVENQPPSCRIQSSTTVRRCASRFIAADVGATDADAAVVAPSPLAAAEVLVLVLLRLGGGDCRTCTPHSTSTGTSGIGVGTCNHCVEDVTSWQTGMAAERRSIKNPTSRDELLHQCCVCCSSVRGVGTATTVATAATGGRPPRIATQSSRCTCNVRSGCCWCWWWREWISQWFSAYLNERIVGSCVQQHFVQQQMYHHVVPDVRQQLLPRSATKKVDATVNTKTSNKQQQYMVQWRWVRTFVSGSTINKQKVTTSTSARPSAMALPPTAIHQLRTNQPKPASQPASQPASHATNIHTYLLGHTDARLPANRPRCPLYLLSVARIMR